MVSKWERGSKLPSRRYQRLLRALFDGPTAAPAFVGSGDSVLRVDYARPMPEALDSIDRLSRADMERRDFLKGALFAVGATIAPSRDWLVATIEAATAPATGRVSSTQVEAIRRAFGLFQEMDVMRGGGHARQQLARYATDTVTPLLRQNDPSTEPGRSLFEAGAEQLYLLGWMAYDDGEHALAQSYLTRALRLAQEANAHELGAHVLAGMSDQATLTGHPRDALDLARTGRAGLRGIDSPACIADLWALQARAEAALGDGKAAAKSVLQSERHAERIRLDNEPEWAKYIDPAYLNGEYAHAFRDLGRPEESRLFATLSADEAARQNRARRGSLAHATLPRAALEDHALEAAPAAAVTTVELATAVRSSRSREAVSDLRARLGDHVSSSDVADFLALADVLQPNA